MLGYRRPQRGTVHVSGRPQTDYTRREMSRLVGLVPQDEHIPFDFSVLEYVLLGRAPYLHPLEAPGAADRAAAQAALAAVGAIKSLLIMLIMWVLGNPGTVAVATGLILAQIGEFSFILVEMGRKESVFPEEYYQLFLSVAVVGMAITPFIISAAPLFSGFVMKARWPKRIRYGLGNITEVPDSESIQDHLVIIGYGVNGRNVARAAQFADVVICKRVLCNT